MKRNLKMAGLVTGVALAAVVGGALVAAQQTPELASASDGDAGPIGSSGTPTAGKPKPSATPSAPSMEPSKPVTSEPTPPPAPLKVKVDLAKLPRGKAPDAPYADGRTVHNGALTFTLPATDGNVTDVVRAGTGVLVVHQRANGKASLTDYSGDGARGESVNDVYTVRSSADSTTSAYSTQPGDGGGDGLVTLHWRDNATGKTTALPLKGMTFADVLAVDGSNVYYSAGTADSDPLLYHWSAVKPAAKQVSRVVRPTAVSQDGRLAASMVSIADGGSCSVLVEAKTGARRWRTCDYAIDEVRTDRDYLVGGPAYRDGYADALASALDADTGKLIREWAGLSFISTAMEDDQQMLMLVENDTHTAIVRCAPRTGQCELATPLKKGTGQQDGARPYALGR